MLGSLDYGLDEGIARKGTEVRQAQLVFASGVQDRLAAVEPGMYDSRSGFLNFTKGPKHRHKQGRSVCIM